MGHLCEGDLGRVTKRWDSDSNNPPFPPTTFPITAKKKRERRRRKRLVTAESPNLATTVLNVFG